MAGRDDRAEEVLRANGAALLGYFARRLPDAGNAAEDAADLLSETMLVVWRRQRQLPAGDEQARMWMFGVARNILANHARSARRRSRLAEQLRLEIVALQTGPPAASDHAERAEARAAVRALPPELFEIVTLVHWEGMSVAEAGRVCGVGASTARSRYARARELLRGSLAEHEPGRSGPARHGPARRETPVGWSA